MQSFLQSLRRNGFKVQRKRSRLLGWWHTHLRVGVAGIWCLLITFKKPGSKSFIWSRTVVKQFQRFQGPLCRIVPTEVIFLLQEIQLGDNSEKLLGFGALHFHLPSKKVTISSQFARSLGDRDPSPSPCPMDDEVEHR